MGVEGWGWEKNGGALDYLEGNEREGSMKMVEWDRLYYPMYMYDYMNGMKLYNAQPKKRKFVPHLCTMDQNAVYKNKDLKLLYQSLFFNTLTFNLYVC